MNVVKKSNGVTYEVYDIAYDKAGYPHFLIYEDGKWLRVSAKYFVPYKEYYKETIDRLSHSLEEKIRNWSYDTLC